MQRILLIAAVAMLVGCANVRQATVTIDHNPAGKPVIQISLFQ